MQPVEFQGQNVIFQAPPNDPDVLPLPVRKHTDASGRMTLTSCWELTEEEITDLIKTRRLYISIYGVVHPPILPFTGKDYRR